MLLRCPVRPQPAPVVSYVALTKTFVSASVLEGTGHMSPQSAAPSDDPIVGRVVGHYRITEYVARGGMGTVYRAEHDLIGKPVAVKVLRSELSKDPLMVQRFFNEAVAASSIRHPGIVEVFDFGHLPTGRAYIVMEFLEGETLHRRLERQGRLSELAAAVIARGISVALAAAHAKEIVHRDLKPDNVFLVSDPELPTGERCKVLDFGIAKLANRDFGNPAKTRTGTFMGTPLYMSPEQARGANDLDHRADIYSLGCMLYEMVTGDPPFIADGAAEILAMQLYGEPVPPRERVPALSAELDDLILRMLAKDPDERPQSASEVVDALACLPSLSERLSAMVMVPGGGTTLHAPVVPTPRSPSPSPRPRGSTPRPSPTTLGASSGESTTPKARPMIVIGAALMVASVVIAFALRPSLLTGEAIPIAPAAAAPAVSVVSLGDASAKPVAAEPEPVGSAEIVLSLRLEPDLAVVAVDGAPVFPRNGRLHLPRDGREHKVTVSAPGYVDSAVTMRADRDQTVAVALAPEPLPPPRVVEAHRSVERRRPPRPPASSRADREVDAGAPAATSPIEEEL
jgi:eukaryotic-like serine/threonine-protein kinase